MAAALCRPHTNASEGTTPARHFEGLPAASPGRHRISLCENDDDDVHYHSLPDRKVKLATSRRHIVHEDK